MHRWRIFAESVDTLVLKKNDNYIPIIKKFNKQNPTSINCPDPSCDGCPTETMEKSWMCPKCHLHFRLVFHFNHDKKYDHTPKDDNIDDGSLDNYVS
jgi:hypothetical protein